MSLTNCSNLHYELSSLRRVASDLCATGPITETINVWLINGTETTLSNNMLQYAGQLLLFNISAMDNQGILCGTLSMIFQLDPSGIINISSTVYYTYFSNYVIVIPWSPRAKTAAFWGVLVTAATKMNADCRSLS